MRNFSADAFINEFEDLMATKFEAEKTDDRQRRPFEGLNRNTLKNFVNSYNKNLSDTWVDKIKKGTMTIEEMQAITNNAYDLLMVKDKNPHYMPANKKSALMNVVAARRAMEKLRKQRGRWWRFWNWRISGREEKYLKKLETQVSELSKANYLVGYALGSSNQKLMEQPKGDSLDSIPEGEAVYVIDKVAEKIAPLVKNTNKFTEQLLNAIPNGRELGKGKEKEVNSHVWTTLNAMVQSYNQNYDNDQAAKSNFEGVVKGEALILFEDLMGVAEMLDYKTQQERIVAAQIMTDMIMKEYTPVRFHPEKYAKYASGYALNNPNATSILKKADPNDIEAARSEYNKIVENKEKENAVKEAPPEETNVINADKTVEEAKDIREQISDIDLGDKTVTETSAFVSEPKPQEVTREIN